MVTPLTPKLTRKAKALAKAPPTIASRREEDASPLLKTLPETGNRKPGVMEEGGDLAGNRRLQNS
jgi:hypothetical protein